MKEDRKRRYGQSLESKPVELDTYDYAHSFHDYAESLKRKRDCCCKKGIVIAKG